MQFLAVEMATVQMKHMPSRNKKLPPLDEYDNLDEDEATRREKVRPGRRMDYVSETERTIINHLKKKLSRRVERRLSKAYESEEQATRLEEQRRAASQRRKRAREERRQENSVAESDIFNRYNDYGEKLVKLSAVAGGRTPAGRRLSNGRLMPLPPTPLRTAAATAGNVRMSGANAELFGSTEDAGRPSAALGGETVSAVQAQLERGGNASSAVRRKALTFNDRTEEVEPELAALDGDADREVAAADVAASTWATVVSPVPTPHIAQRPITREPTKLNVHDRVQRMLRGSVAARPLDEARVARVYVSTTGIDTLYEQEYFVQHLYPQLKDHAAAFDCELQIVDLHWGAMAACIDSHAYEAFCLRELERCQLASSGRLVFALFTSGNYGKRILPTEIHVEEFKAIYASMERDYQTILDEIEGMKAKLLAEDEAEKAAAASTAAPAVGQKDKNPPHAAAQQSQAQGDDEDELPEKTRLKKKSRKDRQANQAILQLIASKERDADAIKPTFLTNWYKLDENYVPAVYRLQRISSQYPDITKIDATRRRAAVVSWNETARRLHELLSKHAQRVVLHLEELDKYSVSLLEREVGQGLAADCAAALWFSKKFDGLQVDDPLAAPFAERSNELQLKMQQLEDAIALYELPDSRVNSTLLEWTKDGFAPVQFRAHQLYIEKVGSKLAEVVKQTVQDQVKDEEASLPADPQMKALYIELSQHVAFCQERARQFHGRKDLLTTVKKYLRVSSPRTPLVVTAKSGYGRKSLVCRSARDTQKWCGPNTAILFRSVGVTGESTNIRTLLYSLCSQLSVIFHLDLGATPTDMKGLVNDFSDKLHMATRNQPLVLIIDSLDQLSDEYEARKLAWLPKDVPPNVHLILSTLPDERYGTLDALRRNWGGSERRPVAAAAATTFVDVGDMPPDDADALLDHWLLQSRRALAEPQRAAIVAAFRQCPNPLYLRTAFVESLSWPSYAAPEQFKLVAGVKRVVTVAFGRLEREHGEAVVRRALGYLTAARRGVTRNELEDLLSLDEAAMDELTAMLELSSSASGAAPVRRCPPFVVVRLLHDIDPYVVERSADGRRTIQWSHALYREAASERYLLQRDKAPSYHKAMAEYFGNKWSGGIEKPVGAAGEQTANRFVTTQGLLLTAACTEASADPPTAAATEAPVIGSDPAPVRRSSYNLRKLSELPYHLVNSQQFDALKSECLCNYEWMLAKLCGCSFRALFDDYQQALAVEPRDKDLILLLETLNLSRDVLERDARQLGSQLVGRIQTIVKRDVPVAPQDPRVYPACHPLVAQVSRSSVPVLVPSATCLTPPGGALADVLVGHKGEVTALCAAADGVRLLSASRDDTMKLWDLRTGRVVASLPGVGRDVLQVLFACADALAVTSEHRCIRVWDLTRSGDGDFSSTDALGARPPSSLSSCLATIADFDDYATLCVTGDGRAIAAYFVGHNTMRSWQLDANDTGGGSVRRLCECQIESGAAIDREKALLASRRCSGDLALVAFKDSDQAHTQNVRTGERVHTLVCAEPSARVLALAVSNDYFIVANRFKFFKKDEPYALDLFSCQGGALVRSVRGCCEDNIHHLEVNAVGSHALCLSSSRQSWCSDLAVWNLETEEHKHLAMHAGFGTQFAASDLRYVASACVGECGVRVWNISASVTKPGSKAKQSVGVASLVPMRDHPRYVVATATDNGPLSVWNAAKGKTSGSAVRIEHGLIDEHDVVVVRNTKAVILGDRRISSVSGEAVFQTVYVYDLRSKRYERKVPNVYIIPSQPHEYALLSDDHLLGLSENRTHFVVWNLSSGGSPPYRIKTNFSSRGDLTHHINDEAAALAKRRNATAKMTPWDRRAETDSARRTRREQQLENERRALQERQREKENGIEQFIISGDEKIIVASFFAHHFCVFDVDRRDHVLTLESEHCLMHLYVAALTYDGSHLVHTNYDEEHKASYVTLWDCVSGEVKRRLKNETDVRALGISDDGRRVLIGRGERELKLWEPAHHGSLRRLPAYAGLRLLPAGNRVFMLKQGRMAVVYAGDVSVWDLDAGLNLAVFTPDTRISAIMPALGGRVLCFGLKDAPSVVILRLMSGADGDEKDAGSNIFGEVHEDSDSDEDGAL